MYFPDPDHYRHWQGFRAMMEDREIDNIDDFEPEEEAPAVVEAAPAPKPKPKVVPACNCPCTQAQAGSGPRSGARSGSNGRGACPRRQQGEVLPLLRDEVQE